MQQDKIGAEIQTAPAMLSNGPRKAWSKPRPALRSAITTVDRFTISFAEGKIDLVYLNLLESKANEYEIKLIEAQYKWFSALAEMQAALGLDRWNNQSSSVACHPRPHHLPGIT